MEALGTRLRTMAGLANYPATQTSREDNPRPAITDPWKPQSSWTMRHPIGARLIIAHHAECYDSPSFKKLSFYLQGHDRIGDTLLQVPMPDASIDPAFDFAYPDRYRRVLLDIVNLATKHYADISTFGLAEIEARTERGAAILNAFRVVVASTIPSRITDQTMFRVHARIPSLFHPIAGHFSGECGTLTINDKFIVGEGLTALASALGNALQIVITRSNRDMRKSALTDISVSQFAVSSDETTGQDGAIDILKAVALCGVAPDTIEVILKPEH